MSQRENVLEWIDQYLNGELSREERIEFEERLKTDKEFASNFQGQKVAHQMVIGKELLEIKAQMRKDLSGKDTGIGRHKAWKYVAGGVVVVTIVLIYFLFKDAPQLPSEMNNTIDSTITDTLVPVPDSVSIEEIQNDQSNKEIEKEEEFENDKPTERDQKNYHKETVNKCGNTTISFSCQARAACLNQENGAIEIDLNTIKEGKAPFQFSVYADHSFTSGGKVSELKQGRYDLYVKDADGCVRRLNTKVEVPSIDCDHHK